jgi:hypothetical protein
METQIEISADVSTEICQNRNEISVDASREICQTTTKISPLHPLCKLYLTVQVWQF